MKVNMDNFEDAIKDYVTKIVNPDNGVVQYVFTKRQKYNTITINELAETIHRQEEQALALQQIVDAKLERRNKRLAELNATEVKHRDKVRKFAEPKIRNNGKTPRGCVTPEGSFLTVKDAAAHYNIHPATMCSRLNSNVKRKVPGWEFTYYV